MIKVERYQVGSKGARGSRGRFVLKVIVAFLLMSFFAFRSDKKIMQPVLALEIKVGAVKIQRSVFFPTVFKYKFDKKRLIFSDKIIYLDNKYQITHKKLFNESLFVENNFGYSSYKKVGDIVKSYDTTGKLLYEAKTKGYPVGNENNRYLPIMLADQASLKFYDEKSNKMVDGILHFASIITAFALEQKTGYYYLAFLDGRLIKGKIGVGKPVWSKSLVGSRISLVKGLFLSKNGKQLAILSGIDPERYTLISTKGAGLWSIRTGGSRRSFTRVKIGRKFCFGYTDKYVYLLDLKDGDFGYQSGVSALEKQIINFADFSENRKGFALVSYSVGKKSTVILLSPNGKPLFRKEYHSPYCLLSFSKSGNAFRVQTDKKLEVYFDINSKENNNAK